MLFHFTSSSPIRSLPSTSNSIGFMACGPGRLADSRFCSLFDGIGKATLAMARRFRFKAAQIACHHGARSGLSNSYLRVNTRRSEGLVTAIPGRFIT